MAKVQTAYRASFGKNILICDRNDVPENANIIRTEYGEFDRSKFQITDYPECFTPSHSCAILIKTDKDLSGLKTIDIMGE